MTSRYDYMTESNVEDIDGEKYPDIFSVNYSDFKLTKIPKPHRISSADISKFWAHMYEYYRRVDCDDILLNCNGIPYIGMLEPGSLIVDIDMNDLLNFNTNKRPECD